MPRLIALRRAIHVRPELGFLEIETAALVVQHLEPVADSVRYGHEVCRTAGLEGLPSEDELAGARKRALDRGVAPGLVDALCGGATGVVVTIKGNRPGPITLMRFDMDALPLQEAQDGSHPPTQRGFRSKHDDVMHACGHDGHVAIGIELGLRLAADRDFRGEVRLVFQPAEEGVRGAQSMLATGVADGVSRVIGLHLGLGLPVGTLAASARGLLATQKWRVNLSGRAAHAALAPDEGRHAVLAAAATTLALHGLPQVGGAVTRLNVGALHGGTSANIVPERAELLVELRADNEAAFNHLRDRARAVVSGSSQSYGVDFKIAVTGRSTTARCDRVEVDRMLRAARQLPGARALHSASMTASDDVTLFMGEAQRGGGTATLVLVGAGSPAPHHHPLFDLDERCLPLAVAWLEAALRLGDA